MANFKTRARALDMLGRQQIAGIPTAISELFKNAHDAYADNVIVDYYRYNDLFVLRDDGVGMTKKGFERRWLTLGTESKVTSEFGLKAPPIDPSKPKRPVMGEKGIGRLAIAILGPQVLILTKAKFEDKAFENDKDKDEKGIVAAFIHWGLFECPGINLEDINIPVKTFQQIPSKEEIFQLVHTVKENVLALQNYMSQESKEKILNDLNAFQVDPTHIDKMIKDAKFSSENSSGTHFYIQPADELMAVEIEGRPGNEDSAPPLKKLLIGFSNTMTPNHQEPRIKASFRYHKTPEVFDDLIKPDAFFTPEEFLKADHHISGFFDEFGQFRGQIKVYDNPSTEHVIPWVEGKGKPIKCGPFKINFAVIQGEAYESLLSNDEHVYMFEKLKKIGGLYIYRDNIRVLPYGNNDVDYLEIEKRRTLKASEYFFSYRRIFGVIEINSETNNSLKDKAGREGFIENQAFWDFKNVLMNFFVQVARDFFVDRGKYSEPFLEAKAEFGRLDELRKREEKKAKVKRQKFIDALALKTAHIKEHSVEEEINDLFEELNNAIAEVEYIEDADKASNRLLLLESQYKKELQEIKKSYLITKPRGLGLSKKKQNEWAEYQEVYSNLTTDVFLPAETKLETTITEATKRFQLVADRRKRIETSLEEVVKETRKVSTTEKKETEEMLAVVEKKVQDTAKKSMLEIENTIRNVMADFAGFDIADLSEDEIVTKRLEMEEAITKAFQKEQKTLGTIRTLLENVDWEYDENGNPISNIDLNEAKDQELLELTERLDADMQLSQLGLALKIVQHEYHGSINSIRGNLQRLKAWADVNQGLNKVYVDMRRSFEHFESYLRLFTPLNRRLHRKAVDISGSAIFEFLKELFGERLTRHEVTINATPAFKKKIVMGYPSSFYPVFVNLIDNAIYWVKGREIREIRLDADERGFIISDSGHGTNKADWEQGTLFERGFSRRPGGQGLGLYISREVLEKEGYTLKLDQPEAGRGATFRIIQLEDESGDEE